MLKTHVSISTRVATMRSTIISTAAIEVGVGVGFASLLSMSLLDVTGVLGAGAVYALSLLLLRRVPSFSRKKIKFFISLFEVLLEA